MKEVLILKLAGIIGAAILLILQAIIATEGSSIENHAANLVAYERLMQEEVKEIRDMIVSKNK